MEERILQAILEFKQSVETRLDKMDSRLDNLESQVKENTQILGGLEHGVRGINVDIECVPLDITHIEKELKTIKQDLLQVEHMTAKNWRDIIELKIKN